MQEKIIFWFRRDLRLHDNIALFHALQHQNVQAIFIFDDNILSDLKDKYDARVSFIYYQLQEINSQLLAVNSSLQVFHGKPLEIFKQLSDDQSITKVFCNEDYEPYAIKRDFEVKQFLATKNIHFQSFTDHIIFHPNEIKKEDNSAYTVFTPYSKKWKLKLANTEVQDFPSENFLHNFSIEKFNFPTLQSIGFEKSTIKIPEYNLTENLIKNYHLQRDFPSLEATSHLSVHLRFGTISIRKIVKFVKERNEIFLNELIWREFFIQILYHFPTVIHQSFKPKYGAIQWKNNAHYFECWKQGKTGFPIVDAGMRELNTTGFMHNRVRMIAANFLCKILQIDWRLGEAYFAEKLLDFELASNNGNWQWSSSSGCDASPYFRIFNPELQTKKFDKDFYYIKKWVKEWNTLEYPVPIVDIKTARDTTLEMYKNALN